jgi:hypothetical protein
MTDNQKRKMTEREQVEKAAQRIILNFIEGYKHSLDVPDWMPMQRAIAQALLVGRKGEERLVRKPDGKI